MRSPVVLRDASALALVFLAAAVSQSPAATVISDGTFDPQPWSQTVLSTAGSATSTASQVITGGNPVAYRRMVHHMPAASNLIVFHARSTTYNPAAQGPVSSLDYKEDHIIFQPPFTGAAVGAAPALLQNGSVYVGPDVTFSNTTWTTTTLTGLLATSFHKISGPGAPNPDFSASGAPIQFGYTRSNTNSSPSSGYDVNSGIDNWSFTLLPEPAFASLALLAILSTTRHRSNHRRA